MGNDEIDAARRESACRRTKKYRDSHKDKVRAGIQKWREENKERILSYTREYIRNLSPERREEIRARDRDRSRKKREQDREAYNARQRKWSRANPEKVLMRNRRWQKKNPDKLRAAKHRRRQKSGEIPFTGSDIDHIRTLQRNKCGYCKELLTRKNEHIDHIVAIASGGNNDRKNIQLLCSVCNQRKAKRDPIYHARQLGMLL